MFTQIARVLVLCLIMIDDCYHLMIFFKNIFFNILKVIFYIYLTIQMFFSPTLLSMVYKLENFSNYFCLLLLVAVYDT